MKRNILLLISSLFFILLVTVGCQENAGDTDAAANDKKANTEKKDAKKEKSELGDYNIQLSGGVIEEGDQFIIEGESNLLPGSRLVGELIVDEGETIYADTSELVSDDGTFYMELEHHQFGEAVINIRFDFEHVQEDEIKRHYGEKGQNLEGPFIYKHEAYEGILKKAEVKINYDPNEANDLTIHAPEWYEKPDDYGDPRVWIEIEEITEDGEYFYVHGRSNILEGSEIRVSYKGNKDRTVIYPDGSFDFKFDYQYVEDEEIVITFEPSSWQWNEIEEAYGTTGQKLVGNLVVSDKYNSDEQYIEKRIPWDNKDAESGSRNGSNDDSSEEDDEINSDEDEDDEDETNSDDDADEDDKD